MNKQIESILLILGIAIMFLLPLFSKAEINLDKHPIYKQIITNKPDINRQYAMKLSNIIHRKSIEYDIDSNLITAILMQESGYDYKAKNCSVGIRKLNSLEIKEILDTCKGSIYENKEGCRRSYWENQYQEDRICTDFGIGQIHYSNNFSFGFKVNLLISDLEYSVDAAFVILSDVKKRYYQEEQYWWTRYNSSTPSYRKKYRKLVQRWM